MTPLAVNQLRIGPNGQVTTSLHYLEFDLFLAVAATDGALFSRRKLLLWASVID